MARHEHLLIWQAVYKLTLRIYIAVHQFPREYKYDLGQRLKNLVSDLLNLIVIVTSLKDKAKTLMEAKLKLEQLRIHLRLANDLGIFGLKRYEIFVRIVEEISKQLSGWLEWAESK